MSRKSSESWSVSKRRQSTTVCLCQGTQRDQTLFRQKMSFLLCPARAPWPAARPCVEAGNLSHRLRVFCSGPLEGFTRLARRQIPLLPTPGRRGSQPPSHWMCGGSKRRSASWAGTAKSCQPTTQRWVLATGLAESFKLPTVRWQLSDARSLSLADPDPDLD